MLKVCHLPEDEQSITISELLTKNNFVRLTTDKRNNPIPIPEMKNNISERKVELKYAQTLSRSSTRTPSPEIKIPDSTPTHPENKIILATDLDIDMWKKIFRIL